MIIKYKIFENETLIEFFFYAVFYEYCNATVRFKYKCTEFETNLKPV